MEKLIVLALLFTSCIETGEVFITPGGTKFKVIEIDSCEYLMSMGEAIVTHKGNCKYCKQRLNENILQTRDF